MAKAAVHRSVSEGKHLSIDCIINKRDFVIFCYHFANDNEAIGNTFSSYIDTVLPFQWIYGLKSCEEIHDKVAQHWHSSFRTGHIGKISLENIFIGDNTCSSILSLFLYPLAHLHVKEVQSLPTSWKWQKFQRFEPLHVVTVDHVSDPLTQFSVVNMNLLSSSKRHVGFPFKQHFAEEQDMITSPRAKHCWCCIRGGPAL